MEMVHAPSPIIHATRAFVPAPLQPSVTLPAPAPPRTPEALDGGMLGGHAFPGWLETGRTQCASAAANPEAEDPDPTDRGGRRVARGPWTGEDACGVGI
eukprot:5294171-Prymnesium_polylepis.1